jgi:hypothetical protein
MQWAYKEELLICLLLHEGKHVEIGERRREVVDGASQSA